VITAKSRETPEDEKCGNGAAMRFLREFLNAIKCLKKLVAGARFELTTFRL